MTEASRRRWILTTLVAGFAMLAVGLAAVVSRRAEEVGERPPSASAPGSGPGSTAGSATTSAATTVPAPTGPSRPDTTPAGSGPPMTTVPNPDVAPATVVRRGAVDRRVVALTFDAGSDTGYAVDILDRMRTEGVPATFGMTGRWAEANPGLVRRMVAEGHQLINHSYDHPSFTGFSTGQPPLPREDRQDQLARADAAIRAAAGAGTVPWFRPPYGDEDASVRHDVALAGYRYELMWTVDSLGWKGDDAGAVARRCLDQAAPGTIYLFHLGSASTDHAALGEIITGLRQQGYGFVTATRLLSP